MKKRVEKLEKLNKVNKTAVFTLRHGKVSGTAFWNDSLTWENLSLNEYKRLEAELKAEGVEVINIRVSNH